MPSFSSAASVALFTLASNGAQVQSDAIIAHAPIRFLFRGPANVIETPTWDEIEQMAPSSDDLAALRELYRSERQRMA